MKAKFFLLLNLFVYLVLSTASAAEKQDLRYNLKVGDAYTIKKTTIMDFNFVFAGNEIEQRKTVYVDQTMRVTDVDAQGNTTALLTFDRCETVLEPYREHLLEIGQKYLPGNSLEVVFTPTGEILKVVGCENISALLCSKMQTNAEKEAVRAIWKESHQKNNLLFLLKYSNEPIAVGESWGNLATLEIIPGLMAKQTSTLKNAEGPVREIAVTLESSIETKNGDFFGVKGCAVNAKCKSQGTLLTASDTGWLLNAKQVDLLSATVEFSAKGISLKVPMKGRRSTITESTKL